MSGTKIKVDRAFLHPSPGLKCINSTCGKDAIVQTGPHTGRAGEGACADHLEVYKNGMRRRAVLECIALGIPIDMVQICAAVDLHVTPVDDPPIE